MPVIVPLPRKWSLEHPSIENGNVGGGGFGPPNPIQSNSEMAHAKLRTAPWHQHLRLHHLKFDYTKMYMIVFTRWLARCTNIPNVNSPNNGPPMIPNIVNDACNNPPQNCATKKMWMKSFSKSFSKSFRPYHLTTYLKMQRQCTPIHNKQL